MMMMMMMTIFFSKRIFWDIAFTYCPKLLRSISYLHKSTQKWGISINTGQLSVLKEQFVQKLYFTHFITRYFADSGSGDIFLIDVTALECLLCCDHADLMHAMCTPLRLSGHSEYFGYKQCDNVGVLGRLGLLHFPDVIVTPQEQYGDITMFLFCFYFVLSYVASLFIHWSLWHFRMVMWITL